jgi:hypothetical protein
MKATYVEVKTEPYDGMVGRHIVTEEFGKYENYYVESREIFKDPITDDGTKKSATGLLRVKTAEGGYALVDRQTWEGEAVGDLQTIYSNGNFEHRTSLNEIRERLKKA